MDYALLTPLRNLTRKLGLNRFVARTFFNNWQQKLAADYAREQPSEATVATNGVTVRMHVANFSEYERVMSFQNDERIIAAILDALRRAGGGTFWDVGSNIGLYSLIVAASDPATVRTVSFEPEPRCAARIDENRSLNGLKNMTIRQLALSSSKGSMRLAVNEEWGAGNHSLVSQNLGGQEAPSVEVAVETGDVMVAERGEAPPTIVKIDVEGAEIEVIRGMAAVLSLPVCRAVMCEVHFTVLDEIGHSNGAATIKQMLKDCGFASLRWVDSSHLIAEK